MKAGRVIAIYSRKSKYTGKGESIGNQVEMAREYISMHYPAENPESVLIYEDEGFSGGNLNRPNFKNMMRDVHAGKIKCIIVYRLDRISRNVSDFSGLIEELQSLDIAFVSIREQFDTATPMGRAMMYIASVFSQLERETIAERIRDNMHELAKTGRWLGGTTPTGYTSEAVEKFSMDGKLKKSCMLKIIPEEAATVRLIYDIFIETKSLTKTEAELIRRGIKTKNGNSFSRYTLKTLLSNPVYAAADMDMFDYLTGKGAELYCDRESFDGEHGLIAYYKTLQKKGKTHIRNPMDQWILSVGKHKWIVEGKKWIAVQTELDKNKDKAYRRERVNEALLTGLIYCSCGSRMQPRLSARETADGKRIFSYVCVTKEHSRRAACDRKNVNGNALDLAVIEKIKGFNENRCEFIARVKKGKALIAGNSRKNTEGLTALKKQLEANERKITSLIDSIIDFDDKTARDRIGERIKRLHRESESLKARIKEQETAEEAEANAGMDSGLLRQIIGSFAATVDALTADQKRAMIRSIVRKVVWDGTDVHIFL